MSPHINIDFSTSLPFWLCALFFILAVAFSIWSYRKTIPPSTIRLRSILIALRSSTLIIFVLLLFGPIIRFTSQKYQPATIGLLLDSSESMHIVDGNQSRLEILNTILTSKKMESFAGNVNLVSYLFADSIARFSGATLDSSHVKGSVTNISQAVKQIAEEIQIPDLKGVVIFSDGGHNTGEDPVRIGSFLDIPVYSIAIGNANQKPDIVMTNILSNDVVYVGDRVPVDVFIRGPGNDGKKVTITLKLEDQIIDQKVVSVPPNGLEKSFRLFYTPNHEGFQKITAEVARLENEIIHENNQRVFYFNVLKNKIKVLLIGGAPDPDVAFLKRLLESDQNINLMIRTQKNGEHFYEGLFPSPDEIKRFDMAFVANFPNKQTSTHNWRIVSEGLEQNKIPFILLMGKNTDSSKLTAIESLLPCRIPKRIEEQLLFFQLTESGVHHPLLQVDENVLSNRFKWQQLPPLYSSWISEGSKPGASVLAVGEKKSFTLQLSNNHPLLFSRHAGNQKSLVLLGNGLYRWDLFTWGTNGTNEMVTSFINNAIRWLAIREEEKTIRLTTNKRIFSAGEKIHFTAQVYDETFQPLEGVRAQLSLSQTGSTDSYQMQDVGKGRYEKMNRIFSSGTYGAEVECFIHERRLGSDKTEISINAFHPEYIDTRAHPGILMALSNVTSGKSGPVDSLSSILEELNYPEEIVQKTREIELLQLPSAFFLIVLLLGIEWFVRKRHGML